MSWVENILDMQDENERLRERCKALEAENAKLRSEGAGYRAIHDETGMLVDRALNSLKCAMNLMGALAGWGKGNDNN